MRKRANRIRCPVRTILGDLRRRGATKCQKCGFENPDNAMYCASCGFQVTGPFQFSSAPSPPAPPPAVSLMEVAGALCMLAGGLSVIDGAFALSGVEIAGYDPLGTVISYSVIRLVFGCLAVVGGVLAINGNHWRLAISFSFFGVIAAGFLIGAALGGMGVIIMSIAREDPGRPPATYAHKKRS